MTVLYHCLKINFSDTLLNSLKFIKMIMMFMIHLFIDDLSYHNLLAAVNNNT